MEASMQARSLLPKILPVLCASVLLASSACPGTGSGNHLNIVLVTIESLRADRLNGPAPSPDPFQNVRALAGPAGIRTLLASSSDTLPSLASILTRASPARHGTLVEYLDRPH